MTAAADIWQTIGDTLGQRLEDDLRDMVRAQDAAAERSQQKALGPSSVGDPCSHCLAAKILGVYQEPPFDDPWCRIVGTAIHDWLDAAAASANVRNNNARWYPELRVHPDPRLLPKGGRCDLYDSDTHTVIDHKTTSTQRLKAFRHSGPGLSYRRQVNLYGLGYQNSGHEVKNVALAFWPRGGRLSDVYVWTEPFNEALAHEALARYELLQGLCSAGGPAIVSSLPSDPDCFTCSRKAAA